MKTYTNHAPGARGIRTKDGVVFLDPGQSVDLDPKSIVGELPDLGKKPDAESGDTSEIDDLKSWVADLTKQVETLTTERDGLAKDKADLTKQVETLAKPTK